MPGIQSLLDSYSSYVAFNPLGAPTIAFTKVGTVWQVSVDFVDFDEDAADAPFLEFELTHTGGVHLSVAWATLSGRTVTASGDGWGTVRDAWAALSTLRDRYVRNRKGAN